MTAEDDAARFCAWLKGRLALRKGLATELSVALDHARNWAGRVVSGQQEISLVEASRVAQHLGSSLGAVLKPSAAPWCEWVAVPRQLADALSDRQMEAGIEALVRFREDGSLETTVAFLRVTAHLPPVAPPVESTRDTTPAVSTKRGRVRHRVPRDNKARE